MTEIYILRRYKSTTDELVESIEVTDEIMIKFFKEIPRNNIQCLPITTEIAKQFKSKFGDKPKLSRNWELHVS